MTLDKVVIFARYTCFLQHLNKCLVILNGNMAENVKVWMALEVSMNIPVEMVAAADPPGQTVSYHIFIIANPC